MIIECPHCRTKFSIDDSLVARSKSPKFHCSRCDNYFTQPDQPTFEPAAIGGTASGGGVASIGAAADFSMFDFERAVESEELTDADLLPDYETEDSEEDYAEEEQNFSELETLKPFAMPILAPPTVESRAEVESQRRESRSGLMATASLLALYPLCLTIVFFLISQGLGRLPESISDRLLLSGKRVPLLPPFGLESKSIKGDVLVLEDGSKVFDLQGEIHNTLPVSYRSLLIEGKLYDESNQLVARIVAPVIPDILGAKINSLSKGAIDEILSKPPTDGGEIEQSKMRPFRMVFTGLKNPERVRYVGARVYSVERPLLGELPPRGER